MELSGRGSFSKVHQQSETQLSKQLQMEETVIAKQSPQQTPVEQVHDQLMNWGLSKESYMVLTPEDANLKTELAGTDGKSVQSYLDNKMEIERTGAKILMGQNNGLTAVYFAEQNVYVVSPSDKFHDIAARKAEDVNLGVMFSNGERFTNSDSKNEEWNQIQQFVKSEQRNQSNDKETPNLTQSTAFQSLSREGKAHALSGRISLGARPQKAKEPEKSFIRAADRVSSMQNKAKAGR